MNPTYRISISVIALMSSSIALATPSRVAGLAGNQGFTDDTDFMVYPTEVSELGQSAWFHYDGDYTGAVTWDGNAVVAGVGPSGGWDMSWTNSHGSTAYGVSAAYLPVANDMISIGGSWGTADRGDGLSNLAVGGNLSVATVDDDTMLDLSMGATSRYIGDSDFSSWGAGVGFSKAGDATDVSVAGQYFMGPRMGDDQASVALSVGTMAMVDAGLGDDGATNLYLALPASNIAGEFAFNDWLMVRGSVVAAVMINHDGEDLSSAAMISGSAGLGFSGDSGVVDITLNPDWALAGPHFLTGNVSGMAGMITARFEI